MKALLFTCMTFISLVSSASTIYLVRHAEKMNDGSKDPELTAQGKQRAENLAAMLSMAEISRVYSTDYQRTQLTAKPLADFLGIPVTSYDPRKLSEFAEQLKQFDGNALVVGHSNTTPMLSFLLSGQPVFNLDETDFDYVFEVNVADGKRDLTVLRSLPSKALHSASVIKPKTANFFTGHLTFNMLFKDEVVGQTIHSFNQSEQTFELHEKTTIEGMNIDADIHVNVNNSLQPVSMKMLGTMGQPVDIELQWSDGKVSGHSDMAREPFKEQGKLIVDESIKSHIYERTAAIMLAHLMPVEKDSPFLLQWFNGYDASNRMIEIKYMGEETLTVPAGTFETIKIAYLGGAPSQYYWIDKNKPKVVQIEVIKMPWKYQLVDFKQ